MIPRVVVLAAISLVIVLATARAEAKSTSWVIAGGDLAPYAATGMTVDAWPADETAEVTPPAETFGPAYDLYPSYSVLAVAERVAAGTPEFTYYPTMRLLHYQPVPDIHAGWFRPHPTFESAFNDALDTALRDRDAGHLERGPVAADLRQQGMDRVQYVIEPFAGAFDGTATAYISGAASDTLVTRHIVDTFGTPSDGAAAELPAYRIRFVGTAIGGELGAYSPPEGGAPGRFWPEPYDARAPYYETTPEMDAFIAGALAPDTAADPGGRDARTERATLVGVAAMLALGAAALFAASRAARRRAG